MGIKIEFLGSGHSIPNELVLETFTPPSISVCDGL